MKRPILIVMAAGMGSRYGGLKQIDAIDRDGYTIIDYSIFDARKAGFETVVFVIRKENEDVFKRTVGYRIEKVMNVYYAYQELNDIPDLYSVPENRVKPWGTAHAIYCCRHFVDGPFAVINADDYYGIESFSMIYDYLSTYCQHSTKEIAMVGYCIEKTLSKNGTVARGICEVNEYGFVEHITERTQIELNGDEILYQESGLCHSLKKGTIVSMNLWGFHQDIIIEIVERMSCFLNQNLTLNPLQCEYFLPEVVNDLLEDKMVKVKVLKTPCQWYGMTYHADKSVVKNAITRMKKDGIYPQHLWESPM